MSILNPEDAQVIKKEFEKLKNDINIIFFTQKFDCLYCAPTEELLKEVAGLSERIKLQVFNFVIDQAPVEKYKIRMIPAIVLQGVKDYGIRFYGIPAGFEFTSLIEDIIDAANGESGLSTDSKKKIATIKQPVHIQVFVTPTCPYCPSAVRLAHRLAIESDFITADMIEATEFPQLAMRYQVMGVPRVIINETIQFEGAQPEEKFVDYVLKAGGADSIIS
ncbi:MAG: thioredoxin family protein [candidate division WOR-3 bacterium]